MLGFFHMSFIIPETAEKGSPRLHLPSDKAGLGRSRWLGPDRNTGLAPPEPTLSHLPWKHFVSGFLIRIIKRWGFGRSDLSEC